MAECSGSVSLRRPIAERMRELHRVDVERLMYALLSSTDESALQVLVGLWRQLVQDEKAGMKMRAHVREFASMKEWHEHLVERSLVMCGDGDKVLLLYTILHAWLCALFVVREEDTTREHLDSIASLKRAHELVMDGACLMLGDGDTMLVLFTAFHRWCYILVEARRYNVDRLQQRHRTDVRKLMFELLSSTDATICHATFGCWHELVVDLKIASVKQKHGRMLEQTVLKLGCDNVVLMAHTVLHAWWCRVVSERDREANAVQLAERTRMQRVHGSRIDYVLLTMSRADSIAVVNVFLRAWQGVIRDVKIASSTAELARTAEQIRETRRSDVLKLLYQVLSMSDASLCHAIMA